MKFTLLLLPFPPLPRLWNTGFIYFILFPAVDPWVYVCKGIITSIFFSFHICPADSQLQVFAEFIMYL